MYPEGKETVSPGRGRAGSRNIGALGVLIVATGFWNRALDG